MWFLQTEQRKAQSNGIWIMIWTRLETNGICVLSCSCTLSSCGSVSGSSGSKSKNHGTVHRTVSINFMHCFGRWQWMPWLRRSIRRTIVIRVLLTHIEKATMSDWQQWVIVQMCRRHWVKACTSDFCFCCLYLSACLCPYIFGVNQFLFAWSTCPCNPIFDRGYGSCFWVGHKNLQIFTKMCGLWHHLWCKMTSLP